MVFFSWLRRMVKEAVLAGLADAVQEIDNPDHTEALTFLRTRFAPALPAPAPDADTEANGSGRKRRVAS